MKQTAVEWLIEKLEGDDSKIARVIGLKKYNSIIKEAKKMEKEQIKKAYYTGNDDVIDNPDREAEQYYKQNFQNK
jgi:GTP-dependent phosphoenolpyruvate carboxykinase